MTDWHVGDLALCVNASPIKKANGAYHLGCGLVAGKVYRVGYIGNDEAGALLYLDQDHPDGRRSSRFRKIRPDEREGDADDWELLLDSVKRAKVSQLSDPFLRVRWVGL